MTGINAEENDSKRPTQDVSPLSLIALLTLCLLSKCAVAALQSDASVSSPRASISRHLPESFEGFLG